MYLCACVCVCVCVPARVHLCVYVCACVDVLHCVVRGRFLLFLSSCGVFVVDRLSNVGDDVRIEDHEHPKITSVFCNTLRRRGRDWAKKKRRRKGEVRCQEEEKWEWAEIKRRKSGLKGEGGGERRRSGVKGGAVGWKEVEWVERRSEGEINVTVGVPNEEQRAWEEWRENVVVDEEV